MHCFRQDHTIVSHHQALSAPALNCTHPRLLSCNTLLLRGMLGVLLVTRDSQLFRHLLPLVRPQKAVQLLRQRDVHLSQHHNASN